MSILDEPIRVRVEWFPPPVQQLSIMRMWPETLADVPAYSARSYEQALEMLQTKLAKFERELTGEMVDKSLFRKVEYWSMVSAKEVEQATGIRVEFTFKWEPDKPKHRCPNCGHEHER